MAAVIIVTEMGENVNFARASMVHPLQWRVRPMRGNDAEQARKLQARVLTHAILGTCLPSGQNPEPSSRTTVWCVTRNTGDNREGGLAVWVRSIITETTMTRLSQGTRQVIPAARDMRRTIPTKLLNATVAPDEQQIGQKALVVLPGYELFLRRGP